MKSVIVLTGCLLGVKFLLAQKPEESPIAKGNEYYKQQQYDLAERQYRTAVKQNPTSATAQYNLANALYQQKKYKEASEVLTNLQAANDKAIKSVAHYNQGVIHTKEKALEASIESYKSALRNNPEDKQARENLQKALLELKKKQQEEQKQNQQKKQNQSNMSKKEAERKLKLLQEKEKELQERMQNKGQKGNAMPKDW